MSESDREQSWLGLPRSLVVVAMPLAGYALAFAFETGFLGWFGVPPWLIHIDLGQALTAGMSLGALVVTLHWVVRLLGNRPWAALLFLGVAPFGFGAFAIAFAAATQWTWGRHLLVPVTAITLLGALTLISGYFMLVEPLREHREMSSWWDRWARKASAEVARPATNVFDAFVDRDSSGQRARAYAALIGFWALLLIAELHGARRAAAQRSFLVSNSAPACAAIRRYGEDFLCVLVDTASKRILPGLRIVPANGTTEQWHYYLSRSVLARREDLAPKFYSPVRSP